MNKSTSHVPPNWNTIASCKTLPSTLQQLGPISEPFARLATLKGRGLVKDLKIKLAEHRLAIAMYRAENPHILDCLFLHNTRNVIAQCSEAITQINAELEYLKDFI